MKASEALLLGSTLIKARAGSVGYELGEPGCALGMIGEATGSRNYSLMAQFNVLTLDAPLPCHCNKKSPQPRAVVRCVMHLFDRHVCTTEETTRLGLEPWTIEQLAHWLAGLEELAPGNSEVRQQEQEEELPCSASISS